MAEQVTPVVEQPAQAPAPAPGAPGAASVKKKQNKRKIKNLITTIIVLAALAVGGFFLYQFLNKTDEVESTMQTATANLSSIQSSVQGSGSARAKESAAITLTQGGTVQEVLVNVGDVVVEGQKLYAIRSQAAEDEVTTAQEKLNNLRDDLNELYRQKNNLQVKAPFAGKIIEVSEFTQGLDVSKGAAVATLVNDRTLKLSLYFSYAYENEISVGQAVTISIPAVMESFSGSVEKINKVHYISPEGADHFEVIVTFLNRGTLTEGMSASAVLTAADGSPIYPYENASTEYYETRKIVTEASGPMLSADLLRYADVTQGQVLLTMGSDTVDSDIRDKIKEIETATETLDKAQKALGNFNAESPISGTVTSCTLAEGQEVKSGDTVITISNNTTMVVNITVDDRNISYVKPGMGVDLTNNYDGSMFYGVVTKIDMSLGGDSMGSGMTNYPVTLEVENSGGTLLEGQWLNYSFVTSQSDDCIVVPMQSVLQVPDENGESISVVFIQADAAPENAVPVELPEVMPGQVPKYPSEKDGYYAVPVTTGLSDNYNVEIKEGLAGGETIFVNYYVEQAWG